MAGVLLCPDSASLAPADSSDESDSSEESDIDSEASSALFMAVRSSLGLGRGVSVSRLTPPTLTSAEKEDTPQEGAEAVWRQLTGQQPPRHPQCRGGQHLLHAAGRCQQTGAG